MAEWRNWFDSRLDDAIEAAATQDNPQIEGLCTFLSRAPRLCVFEIFKNDHRDIFRDMNIIEFIFFPFFF